MPWRSKVAVFRFALRRSLGSGKSLTARVAGSTRAIAFCPPSVIQAAPSGPTITPWGAAAGPSAIRSDFPVLGVARRSGWEGSDNQDRNPVSRHWHDCRGVIVAQAELRFWMSRRGDQTFAVIVA